MRPQTVVDGGVEPELLGQIPALVCTAGDTNDSKAFDLADLSDDGSNGTGGRGYDERFARLRLPHFEQPEIGGPPRHPESADPAFERCLASLEDARHGRAFASGLAA